MEPSSSSTSVPRPKLMEEFERDMKNYNKSISEVCDLQQRQLLTLQAISQELHGNDIETIDTMMQVIKVYREKLIQLRTRMLDIHSRGRAVKEKALKIQQMAVSKSADRVEKLFYEENLIKKSPKHVATAKESSTTTGASDEQNIDAK